MSEHTGSTARIDKRDCRRLLAAGLVGSSLEDAPDLVRFRRPRPEVADREPTHSGRT